MYLLPVVISDNEYPIQSSTETVTIRVCACDQRGKMLSCNAEALIHPTGLSTGALVAILLCIIILLGKGLEQSGGGGSGVYHVVSYPSCRTKHLECLGPQCAIKTHLLFFKKRRAPERDGDS